LLNELVRDNMAARRAAEAAVNELAAARRAADAARQDAVVAGDKLLAAAVREGEFRLIMRELCLRIGIVDARGAYEHSMGLHSATSREGLVAFLSDEPLGELVLSCVNKSAKVRGDNGDKPHTPSTLATKLLAIKTRLNEDSRDRRSPAERAGAPIVLPGSLNFSERHVLTCLLTSFGYEVAPSPDRVDVNV